MAQQVVKIVIGIKLLVVILLMGNAVQGLVPQTPIGLIQDKRNSPS